MNNCLDMRIALNLAINKALSEKTNIIEMPISVAINIDDLLKEAYEPRVLTLEEAFSLQERTPYPCIFVEIKDRNDVFIAFISDEIYGDYHSEDVKVSRPWAGASRAYHKTEYGKAIRFWNLFPTDEQRRAVKWDD